MCGWAEHPRLCITDSLILEKWTSYKNIHNHSNHKMDSRVDNEIEGLCARVKLTRPGDHELARSQSATATNRYASKRTNQDNYLKSISLLYTPIQLYQPLPPPTIIQGPLSPPSGPDAYERENCFDPVCEKPLSLYTIQSCACVCVGCLPCHCQPLRTVQQ